MKSTLLILALTLPTFSFAGEKWDKTKKAVNETAEDIDRGTRKIIKKGKAKLNKDRQEEKKQKQ